MTIRRKRRVAGSEAGGRVHPPQAEAVQRKIELLSQFVQTAMAQAQESTAAAMAAVPAFASGVGSAAEAASDASQAVYASQSPGYGEGSGVPTSDEGEDSRYVPKTSVPDPDKIMNQADAELRAAMEQAQQAIKNAEVLLLKNEEATEDRVAEAQRIAEQAVVNAMSQTDALLHGAMRSPAPGAAPAATVEGVRSEVQ